jgi:nucleoside-triphosphatase THEP1
MSPELTPVLAAVQYEPGFDINSALRAVVARLRERGVRVGGVLQEGEVVPHGSCAPLHIVDIRTGISERITQDSGRESRGCRLDPRGLAEIAHCLTDAIEAGTDLIIVNKFGRAESEGGGLLSSIADAVIAGVPVLTTVREPYVESWRTFHGGLATELSTSADAILRWCEVSGRHRSTDLLMNAMGGDRIDEGCLAKFTPCSPARSADRRSTV